MPAPHVECARCFSTPAAAPAMPCSRGPGRVIPRDTSPRLPGAAGSQADEPAPAALLAAAAARAPPLAQQQQQLAARTAPGEAPEQSPWRVAAPVLARATRVGSLSLRSVGDAASRVALRRGEPLQLTGHTLTACRLASSGGSSSAQAAAADAQPRRALRVLCSPASANRWMPAVAAKNVPGSYYHVRKPDTSELDMSFSEWLAAWQAWDASRLLLQADVCSWELQPGEQQGLRLWPNTAVWPHLTRLLAVPGSASDAPAAAPGGGSGPKPEGLLDWALLAQLLEAGGWQGRGSLGLLAGGRDGLLPARFETHDRLLLQTAGRLRVLLLPPGAAFRGASPFAVQHPHDQFSMVAWEDEADVHAWPGASEVRGLVCTLSPGDALLVPAWWWAHMQLEQPACIALVLALQPGPARLEPPDALVLQASRMIELWFAADAGTANVRHWLKALAEGREWALLDGQLATVKGYKLLRACDMALRQLQEVLSLCSHPGSLQPNADGYGSSAAGGCNTWLAEAASAGCRHTARCGGLLECAARLLLGAMCEERLVPTPWLDEGLADPLYLRHPPAHFVLEEDAEAAAYPSLFRHRLLGERGDWMAHARPLQLRGARQSAARLSAGGGEAAAAAAAPALALPAGSSAQAGGAP